MTHIKNIEDYNNEVNSELVLVDFFATWCGPCKMVSPILEEIEKEINIKIVKVDVDEAPQIAQQFNIVSVPTLLLYKNGKVVKQMIGYKPKNALLADIEEFE